MAFANTNNMNGLTETVYLTGDRNTRNTIAKQQQTAQDITILEYMFRHFGMVITTIIYLTAFILPFVTENDVPYHTDKKIIIPLILGVILALISLSLKINYYYNLEIKNNTINNINKISNFLLIPVVLITVPIIIYKTHKK